MTKLIVEKRLMDKPIIIIKRKNISEQQSSIKASSVLV